MGYTTDFEGKFDFNRQLTLDEKNELEVIHDTRHDDEEKYPSIWCQWVADDGLGLEWDQGEKFYNYVEWLEWLIKEFFEPRGIKLNGEVWWYGEERDDMGKIIVNDNQVIVRKAKITY